jgi:hypothetical protein
LSIPSKYFFLCARRKFRFNKKIVENYLMFTCITNKIIALHPWSVGWRNLSKTVEKEFLQPMHSKCTLRNDVRKAPPD